MVLSQTNYWCNVDVDVTVDVEHVEQDLVNLLVGGSQPDQLVRLQEKVLVPHLGNHCMSQVKPTFGFFLSSDQPLEVLHLPPRVKLKKDAALPLTGPSCLPGKYKNKNNKGTKMHVKIQLPIHVHQAILILQPAEKSWAAGWLGSSR